MNKKILFGGALVLILAGSMYRMDKKVDTVINDKTITPTVPPSVPPTNTAPKNATFQDSAVLPYVVTPLAVISGTLYQFSRGIRRAYRR